MKNFTFLAIVLFSFLTSSNAQPVKRCITDEVMQDLFRRDPAAKLRFEANQKILDQKLQEYLNNPNARLQRTNAIISVPVVAHIILTNPNLVTDATVQAQLDTLNWYYGSQSANDSLRVYTPFRTVYGRSQIRFCLAQRTPAGLPSNGIDRVTSSTTFVAGGPHPSTVAPAWNSQLYLNMWVVNFPSGNILGYSYLPGTFPPGDQRMGYVCDYRAFGSNASYLFPPYNGGKTAVHEIGHYFNLNHPWSDNSNAATNNAACSLDDGCSDTPLTSDPIFGCPSTIPVLNRCNTIAPGVMWQNHMDYADDACMVLFTKQQATRMETALNSSPDRTTLLTSNGCQSVATNFANDAGIGAIITPTASVANCITSSIPQVTLVNFGTNNLTSVAVTATVNGTVQTGYPYSWTGALLPGAFTNLTLPVINLAAGNNTVVFTTSQPNGVADSNATNNSKTIVVNRAALLNLPVFEGFESTTFPPAPWTVVSVNTTGTKDWVRNSPGNASTGALYINNYLNSNGAIDDFRSGNYSVNATDSIRVTFDVAYRPFNSTSPDSLLVLVSNDCGVSFSEVYKKWGLTTSGGNSLSTVLPASTLSFTPASAADWRKETIIIPASLLTNGRLQVTFRSKSRFGNNIWIDNINIEKIVTRDLKVVSIASPTAFVCSNTISPQVTVTNNGAETITSFQLNYSVNGVAVTPATVVTTPLAAGASTTVTLATGNVAVGNAQSIVITVSNVTFTTGLAEQEPGNNTASGNFTVVALQNIIREGFEVIPVVGWTVSNPDADNTWGVISPGNNSLRSAFINNFNFNAVGHIDDLRSPFVNTSNYDSLFISFDLAHKNFTGSNDKLEVFAVTGCGTTFTPTGYAKAGTVLATAGSSPTSYLVPVAGDWRRENIAIGRSILGSGSNALIAFRNTNAYGNNIFIDNVNITPLFKRDLQLLSLNQPGTVTCASNITPSVTVKNSGSETITGYKVQYVIDNGTPQTATVITGVSIPHNGTATINLTASTVAVGAHTIKVYSFEPVTASGTGDQNTLNDTLSKSFNVLNTVAAPLVESFASTTFPPINWTVLNPDGGITWRRYAQGNGNAGSAYVNTYNYQSNGQKDDLLTPFISYSGVDSVNLAFDLAAVTYSYPGSTEIPIDTLEVLVTKDCGNSFTSVYKKWGIDLQTINAPNDPQSSEFFPAFSGNWRKESIDLTQYAGNSPISVMFRVTNNFENNIFIDNVNFSTRTLPALLKQQGYLILPTVFNNSFAVWHYQTPSSVKYMRVYNSAGQMVYNRQFNGNADKQVQIDLTGKAAGLYVVEIGYMDGNRNVRQKVIKH